MKLLTSATLVSLMLSAQNVLAQVGSGKALPEPGVWALLGIGAAAFAARHFMKKR